MSNAVFDIHRGRDRGGQGVRSQTDEEAARLMVFASVARLLFEKQAKTARLESGALEVRLPSGAVFILGENGVERVA